VILINTSEKLTGVQKVAILFIALGSETAANIVKRLPDSEIEKITYEIANITSLKSDQKESILQEFVAMNKAKDYLTEGGIEYATKLLSKALGSQKAAEILEKVSESKQQFRPFSIARRADAFQLSNLIANEHPQTIALILCYLQADKAAQVLAALSEDVQAEVAYRIANMSATSPEVVSEIEKVLDSKLSSVLKSELKVIGGIETIVNILNQVDRTTEKNITEGLESQDPELAEKVKSSMFVFEDITSLDDVSIQRLLREIDNKELALALKGCSEDVSNIIYKNQSKRASQTLKEDIEFLGPVRLNDVEKAQQRIVAVIRKLEEDGEIVISRGGEDAIII